MADEPKNPNKPEVPKDIEDLLKDLPKIGSPNPTKPSVPLSPPKPISPLPPVSLIKPPLATPPAPPAPPAGGSKPPITPLTPPPLGGPKTIPVPPAALPGTEDKFKSLIRTMNQDLEAAKKGQKSEPKPFEIKPPPVPGPKPSPLPPEPPQPSEIKLGPAERTRSLDIKGSKTPSPDVVKRKLPISPKFLIIILAVLVLVAGAWYFLNRPQEGTVVLAPTPTPTPARVMPLLSEIFENPYLITIPESADFMKSFNDSVKKVPLSSFIQFKPVMIADENNNEYALNDILDKLGVAPPDGFLESLDPNDRVFVAYGQQEEFDEKGFMKFLQTPKVKFGLIAKAADPELLRSALNTWEASLASDLKNFLAIDPQKATSQIFLDNFYNNTGIRYLNFPYSDNTIDYAILNLPEFNSSYFILTDSRESIYSAIDLLKAR